VHRAGVRADTTARVLNEEHAFVGSHLSGPDSLTSLVLVRHPPAQRTGLGTQVVSNVGVDVSPEQLATHSRDRTSTVLSDGVTNVLALESVRPGNVVHVLTGTTRANQHAS